MAWQNDNLHKAAGAYANSVGYANSFILAPNYPAGQDALTGYKRFYDGELSGELFTQLGQTDYAAEIAQIRASGADSVFFFLPGGMGISFLKQYADSGLDIPVIGPEFSFDQGILQAVGDAALGVVNTSRWNKDLENPTNAAFVDSFQAEYGRLPSLYASQGFDTANLLISALDAAGPADADAFRDALRTANSDSTRGAFAAAGVAGLTGSFVLVLICIGRLVAAGLGGLITKTRIGIQIRADENDREMTAALGVDISRLYTLIFALGAGLAGLAGALVGAIQFFARCFGALCLAERSMQVAGSLSGGEQQMLSIGRALMTNPRMLILDEATEGLAPLIRQEIWDAVSKLKVETGMAILVIDKTLVELRAICDRATVLEKGRTVWAGPMIDLEPAITARYVGI